jgi:dTDP-4-dehydrorhamnose reductase
MKFLIFGGNGLVGSNLIKVLLQNGYNVAATAIEQDAFDGAIVCDILDNQNVEKVFREVKPDITINATNLSGGVDFCENNPHLSKSFHYDANVSIGKYCLQHKSRYVIISTDYVFDGLHGPYAENDKVNPLNVYGNCKLMAEQWMLNNLPDPLIVRTTNIFGWDPFTTTPNFLMGLYFKLKENMAATVPTYLWGNPTHAEDLSKAITELCEKKLKGIFHVVGSSFISRYNWAVKFCRVMDYDESLIIKSENIPEKIVPRPFKSNLSTNKFRSECNTTLHNVDEGLKKFKEVKIENEKMAF